MAYISAKQRRCGANHDQAVINSNTYSNASGAVKQISGGHYLKSIPTGAATAVTDCSGAAFVIGQGLTVALYNNDNVVHAVIVGGSAIAAPAVGTIDPTGAVGIPLKANDWTYVNTFDQTYIRTDSNKVICFIVEDDTYIQ
ncbi:MAG: hypothetical protein PHF86_09670 [Candidatus Nanoarchaeia archaeon]|jgi:hypothetical protein|nr:hypothetical protein [Candidatus Nanoarchaeia archaeon]